MVKRRIHLTESRLYGLVEQTLNELDWRTKAQLANARSLQASNALLYDASPEEEKYWNKVWPERDLSWLNASAAVNKDVGKDTYGYSPFKTFSGDPAGHFYKRGEKMGSPNYEGYDDDYYSNYGFDEDFMKQVGPYLRQESYYDNTLKRWLDPDDEGYDKERNAEFWRQEKLKRPNKDDDERYKRSIKNKQKNESLARRVTESVIHLIREQFNADEHTVIFDRPEEALRFIQRHGRGKETLSINTDKLYFGGGQVVVPNEDAVDFMTEMLDWGIDWDRAMERHTVGCAKLLTRDVILAYLKWLNEKEKGLYFTTNYDRNGNQKPLGRFMTTRKDVYGF